MRLLTVFLVCALSACSSLPHATDPPPSPGSGGVGILVMAHGAGAEWNTAVAEAVDSLRVRVPTAVAFGMADATTLAAGLDSLRQQNVGRVAVVRLFVSGASFLEQTEYLLGLRQTPPPFFLHHGPPGSPSPEPLHHGMQVATHETGLADGSAAHAILVDRAREISADPTREAVLVLAHGMGDPGRNGELLARMEGASPAFHDAGFAAIRMETLREDWPEARREAEARIRAFVEGENGRGREVLVLPLRVSGFGPYEEVLDGLRYRKGRALLPHPEVTRWIRRTASAVICRAGWTDPWATCPSAAGSGNPGHGPF